MAAGEAAIDSSAAGTVTAQVALLPETVAVTVAVPAPTAVITPAVLTVATLTAEVA